MLIITVFFVSFADRNWIQLSNAQDDAFSNSVQEIKLKLSLDMPIITVFLYLLQKETGFSCQMLKITLCSKSVQEINLGNSSHNIQMTVNGVTDCR